MKETGRKFSLEPALMPVTSFRIPMTMSEKIAMRTV
jgi:hypothetical protein